MLAVVQQQQPVARGERCGQAFGAGAGRQRDAHGGRHRRRDLRFVSERRELNTRSAVCEGIAERQRHGVGQFGLADTARASDAHEAFAAQQVGHFGAFHLAANEHDSARRQAARRRRPRRRRAALVGGQHRPPVEPALDIVEQRVDAAVALVHGLAQGLQQHGIEVARECGPHRRVGRRLARPRGNAVDHRLFEGRPRAAFAAVRPGAAQQLVQHHAQGIDIRNNAERLAAQLFRRCVIGRQRPAEPARQLGLDAPALVEQLGDAEVEQPGVALRIDEHVRRFDVAVQHLAAICVGGGRCRLRPQRQALAQTEGVAAAVGVDRLAFDELEHEEGPARIVDAGVEQTRDAGMLERRQNRALALRRSLPSLRRQPACGSLTATKPPAGAPSRCASQTLAMPPAPSSRSSR
jgi:hypothetical protein